VLELQELLDLQVQLDQLEPVEMSVQQASLESQDLRESLGLPEQLEKLAHREMLDHPELLEQLEHRVHLDLLEL
jgi:hypothetical protein